MSSVSRLSPYPAQAAAGYSHQYERWCRVLEGDDENQKLEETFGLGFLAREVLSARHTDRPVSQSLAADTAVQAGRQKGGRNKNREYTEQRAQYQVRVDQLMNEQNMNYTAACKKIARESKIKVDERTIREHTINKKPFNRGGRKKNPK